MVYLKKKTLQEALHLLEETLEMLDIKEKGRERVSTKEALSRITYSPIRAQHPVPYYRAAAMDGIAIRAEDSFGATRDRPKVFALEEILPVNTGDPVPEERNAVIKIEDTKKEGDHYYVYGPATPNQHIRPIGEDIEEGMVVIPQNQEINPQALGALLSCGRTTIDVKKKPCVAILPTGSELVSPGAKPKPGEVVEYNSEVIAAMVSSWGGEGVVVDKIEDDPLLLKRGILELAKEYRVIVTIAGSSAGTKDYMASVLGEIGDLLLHGLSIRPGKPMMMAIVGSSLLLGLPGYPVSCYLDAHLFLQRIVYTMQGLAPPPSKKIEAILGQDILSSYGVDEFVRVSIGEVQGERVAYPLARGASLISTLTRGEGLLLIPRLSRGALAKDRVVIELLPRDHLLQHIFISGSHHPLLKALRDALFSSAKGIDLHLGGKRRGITGLEALKNGLSHMASLYLPWDSQKGSLTASSSASILHYLERDRAFFLQMLPIEEARRGEPLFSKEGEELAFGLLFVAEEESLQEVINEVRSEAFKALVEERGFKSQHTGAVEQLRARDC